MAENTGTKILEGALIAGVVAVGAAMLANSKFGKKLGKDIHKKSVGFYKYLAPQLKKFKNMTGEQYKSLVKDAASRYSKDKKLTADEAKHLLREAQASWSHIKKNL